MPNQPNIFFVIIDQQAYPFAYESPELKLWKEQNLHFAAALKTKGTEFHRHYTNTNACVPARTTIQTGTYPLIHGSYSTDGAAKNATDPLMTWLHPHTVPTMGNYLREAGYTTVLKGKWHVTDANILGQSKRVLPTFDYNGVPIIEAENRYLERNVLDEFGYDGWIGPEPHGRLGVDSASSAPPTKIGRDVKFANQIIDTLGDLDRSRKPWFLCANMVDPHDIVLFGDITQLRTLNFDFTVDPTLPTVMWTQDFIDSMNENLSSKPVTQTNWKNIYPTAFQPISDIDKYWRYYYTCMKRVDEQLMRIWNKLITMREFDNTAIVFTSDHGGLLGAHGRQFQKWFQAYEESIHVPLIIVDPTVRHQVSDVYDYTSHIDLLPTLIDFAGKNILGLADDLKKDFSSVAPLPGRSIRSLVGGGTLPHKDMYFMTEDNITQGNNQVSLFNVPYTALTGPTGLECVKTIVDGVEWKMVYYYNPANALRQYSPQFFEMYNLTDDPFERLNQYSNPALVSIKTTLMSKLVQQSFVHNKMLNELNVPGAPLVIF